MNLIPKVVTRSIGRQILTTKKNSPHIFFAAGIAGVVGSTVLACRATLKLEETVDDIKSDVLQTKAIALPEDVNTPIDESAYNKSLLFAYSRGGAKLGRLYAPSIALGGISIAALTGSHIQLARRNTALTATVAAVMKAYDEYRIRVQEVVGEERELDIHRGVREETALVDGKKQTIKVLTDPNSRSIYSRIFDTFSPSWQKDPEMNRIFLTCQQNYMNHILHARGHVFLNEVYDQLGFERTSAGAVVGWVISETGDNYIDFGMFEAHASSFLDGTEPCIVLDFNVDGVIYDKI